ncbi:hypothetical protein JOC85_002098 [Bacillus mesophilus]|nr:hypothetical protein [Bacillus mesophilus]
MNLEKKLLFTRLTRSVEKEKTTNNKPFRDGISTLIHISFFR